MGKRVKLQIIDPKTNNLTDVEIVTSSDNVLFQDGQSLTQKLQNNKYNVEVTNTLPAKRNSTTIYFKI